MDRREAAALLGVDEHATAAEVRTAFRRHLLRHHPDVAGGDGATARLLTEAYRGLRQPAPEVEVEADAVDVIATADDTLVLALPPDEAFDALLDAGAAIGEVTYVDAVAGLLEVVVTFDDGRRASAVVSLQGRATGTTDAFVTLEPLGPEAAPPPSAVIAALVEALA